MYADIEIPVSISSAQISKRIKIIRIADGILCKLWISQFLVIQECNIRSTSVFRIYSKYDVWHRMEFACE